MDLSKAEKTLNKLEENSSKIEKISAAVEDLGALQEKLETLPSDIKKPLKKAIEDFENLKEELKSLPDDIKKESSIIETSLRSKIVELENSLLKKIDQLGEGISTLIKNNIKDAKEDTAKQFSALKDELNVAKTENANHLKALKDELNHSIDEKLRSTNRNTIFLMVMGIIILGLLSWYIFSSTNLF